MCQCQGVSVKVSGLSVKNHIDTIYSIYVFRYTENENELLVHALTLSPAAAIVAARAGAPGEPFTKTPTAVAAVS